MSKKYEAVTAGYLDKKLIDQMNDIGGLIQTFMTQVDERFDVQDLKFNARFDKLEAKVDSLQVDMTAVINRLDLI